MTETEKDGMQVGDTVILHDTSGTFATRSISRVAEVVRRTKTQVVVRVGGKERRFLATGFQREVGSNGYHFAHLERATPEAIADVHEEVQRRGLLARIGAQKMDTLTTDQLLRIVSILAE